MGNVSTGSQQVVNSISNIGQQGGVSILNISDDSTRMLIPNNFLTTKHVYFVKYHPNGTNLYDYKMGFKGGAVSNLYLKNIDTVWNNNNPVDYMSNNSITNGIKILNNLITDLSSSSQFGGFIQNRVCDKDKYYYEYKNYKLKYLQK
jgi:hypothetical protein